MIVGTDLSEIWSHTWQQSVVTTVVVRQDQRVIEASRW